MLGLFWELFGVQKLIIFLIDFWIVFGCQNAPQNVPKTTPKRSKIEVENQHGKKRSLGASRGRFWVILSSLWGVKIIKFHWFLQWFRENRRFSRRKRFETHFESFLTHFGSFLLPKMEPKWHQKRIKKQDENLIDF